MMPTARRLASGKSVALGTYVKLALDPGGLPPSIPPVVVARSGCGNDADSWIDFSRTSSQH